MASRSIALFAYDRALERSSEDAMEDIVIAYVHDGPACAPREVASVVSAALASRALVANVTSARERDRVDDDASDDANARCAMSSCTSSSSTWTIATLEIVRGTFGVGARVARRDAATLADVDLALIRAMTSCARAIGSRYARDGIGWSTDRRSGVREALENAREAFERERELGSNASSVRSSNASAPDVDGEHPFAGQVAFYAEEDVERRIDALTWVVDDQRKEKTKGGKAMMDARTTATAARARRDFSRIGSDVRDVFVKPAHEAWVCATTCEGKRLYVAVEETSDTLLRAVRQAKTFANAKFPAYPNAFDV